MSTLHDLLGVASVAGSLMVAGAALWSVIAGRRSGGISDHRFAVDRAVMAMLLVLAAAGLVGLLLLLNGSRPTDPLHLLYGPASIICLPVLIWIGSHAPGGRAPRLRRDVWTAGGGIILLGLALRLYATG